MVRPGSGLWVGAPLTQIRGLPGVGLDVHALSVRACGLDTITGQLIEETSTLRTTTTVVRRRCSSWHNRGMSRTRLSTTVDTGLLENARKASGKPDSALVDEALAALLARHRAAEVDASYAAYDTHPLDEPDAWGDLASFRRAVAAS